MLPSCILDANSSQTKYYNVLIQLIVKHMFWNKKTVFMDTPKQTDRQTSKETLELPDLVNRHIKRPSKKDDDGHGGALAFFVD